jgi:hypothetical protein
VEPDAGLRLQLEVLDAEVGHLLDASTGVVQEKEEHAIAECVAPAGRQSREEGADFVALQEVGFRRSGPLAGDGRYALADREQLRISAREVLEEGVDGRQALVASPDVVAANLLQVPQEPKDSLEGQVLDDQPRDPGLLVRCYELQKKSQRVPIAADGGRPQAFEGDQVIDEERVEGLTEWLRCHGDTSRRIGPAAASKRRLASQRSSSVMVRYTAVEAGLTWPRNVDS